MITHDWPLRMVVGHDRNTGGGETDVLDCGHAVDSDRRKSRHRRCPACAVDPARLAAMPSVSSISFPSPKEATVPTRPARWKIVSRTDDTLTIRDVGQECRSVTNDAENVVATLHRDGSLGTRTLLYYDSDGSLDELQHDGAGVFTGFAPGPGRA